jgi:hypothetical protein
MVDVGDATSVPEAELFLDERGSLLRARWDPASGIVQLSVWRDGRCVATHALSGGDAARLSALLTEAWASALQPETTADAPSTSRSTASRPGTTR